MAVLTLQARSRQSVAKSVAQAVIIRGCYLQSAEPSGMLSSVAKSSSGLKGEAGFNAAGLCRARTPRRTSAY